MKAIKPLKNYEDEDCLGCLNDLKYRALTVKDLEVRHNNCHGWYHCGDKCCGPCSTCGE